MNALAPTQQSPTTQQGSPPAGTLLEPVKTSTTQVEHPPTTQTTTQQQEPPKEPASTKEPAKDPAATLLDTPPGEEPTGAPEAYADFTLPEGFEMTPELKTEAETLLKELNLPQDKAQKAVDFFTAKIKASGDANAQAFADLKADWRKEAVTDSTIGTGTQIKPEVLQSVGRAIDGLGAGAKAFREAMNLTGVGDNPAFIRAIYEWSKQTTEGRPVSAAGPAPVAKPGDGKQSLAQSLYPNLPA